MIVPYAAGGGTDAIARLVAQAVAEKLGQTVVVENNGVGAGNVATQTAALAAPDGYTILMANQGPMVVNPHLFKSMKVDPLTAFDPICLIAIAPLVVVAARSARQCLGVARRKAAPRFKDTFGRLVVARLAQAKNPEAPAVTREAEDDWGR